MEQFDMFVGIFLAFSLVFLASLYLKYGKKIRERDAKEHGCPVHKQPNVAVVNNDNTNTTENQNDIHKLFKLLHLQPNNETVINEAFDISLQILKTLPKNVSLSTDDQLQLYGLYKQANIGDNNKSEPSKLHFADYAKWQSWNTHKNKTKLQAKKEYFEFVYDKIIKTFNLNVLLFNENEEIPEDISKEMNENQNESSGHSMSFGIANSKMEQFEFNEELHGDPNELFNKFDLTEIEVNNKCLNEIKDYILEHKIDINKQNENGTTFLNFAVDNDKYELTKLLINKFNANVNLGDDMGYTPLHCAAMSGNKQVIKLLIENGANINAKSNDDDEIPADLAESDHIKQMLTTS
eukprot:118917_1